MSLADDKAEAVAATAAADIDKATRESFAELMHRIRNGETPRKAIEEISQGWRRDIYDGIAKAFSDTLGQSIGRKQVADLPIGEVSLSDKLYRHNQEVGTVARGIIEEHAKALRDVRGLAKKLYEGYGFTPGGDALDVKAQLPKYLRNVRDSSGFERDVAALLARAHVERINTPALKASYLKALDAIEKGAGAAKLQNALRVAWYERNRYLANRIAQTELHRANMARRAGEMIGDDAIEFVQVRMSQTHPAPDRCDYHATVDKYGLGAGVYPKLRAPLPPFHPHCRCRLIPRLDIAPGTKHELDRDADERYFRDLDPDKARRVAGSSERLRDIYDGRLPTHAFDSKVPDFYRTRTLGEADALPVGPDGRPGFGVNVTNAPGRGKVKPRAPDAAKPAPTPPAPVAKPHEYLNAGDVALDLKSARKRFDELGGELFREFITPHLPALDAGVVEFANKTRGIHDAIVKRLAEVRGSIAANVIGAGEGAKAVRSASKRYPAEWVTQANAVPIKAKYIDGRGGHWATRPAAKITTDDSTTATHEYGHHIQMNLPGLDVVFQSEHRARTAGEALQPLKVLQPGYKYRPDEVARPDGYANAYQGKEYKHAPSAPALEVLTMAFEAVLGGERYRGGQATALATMVRDDPGMVRLALGLLFHYKL